MKAQDSVKNYPSALREMTNFSVRGIKKICKDVGPRPAGSEQEHEAQKLMAPSSTARATRLKSSLSTCIPAHSSVGYSRTA